jgi:hypothetical protein
MFFVLSPNHAPKSTTRAFFKRAICLSLTFMFTKLHITFASWQHALHDLDRLCLARFYIVHCRKFARIQPRNVFTSSRDKVEYRIDPA